MSAKYDPPKQWSINRGGTGLLHPVPAIVKGHGRLIKGVYQTAGKRSPSKYGYNKGILYEGMFNNWVGNRLIEKLDRRKVPYYEINPEPEDISLRVRTNRLNRLWAKDKSIYGFGIHANGGGGKGIEGFTSPGSTTSDIIAENFLVALEQGAYSMNNQKMRFDWSDGDRDKEARFWMLVKSHCPYVLFELGFMDNIKDYNNLWDEDYIDVATTIIANVMEDMYKNGIRI